MTISELWTKSFTSSTNPVRFNACLLHQHGSALFSHLPSFSSSHMQRNMLPTCCSFCMDFSPFAPDWLLFILPVSDQTISIRKSFLLPLSTLKGWVLYSLICRTMYISFSELLKL